MIRNSLFLRSIIRRLVRTGNALSELSPGKIVRRRKVQVARQRGQRFVANVPAIGSKMVIDPQTFFSKAYIAGTYEPEVVRFLKSAVRPDMTCVDVGANVGYFTLLMAKLAGPDGRIIAFEPAELAASTLQQNVRLNRLENVSIEPLAVYSHDGELEFHEGPPGYDVYNTLGLVSHPSAAHQSFASRPVLGTSLQSYFEAHTIANVDVIKIDAEGAELGVLQGMGGKVGVGNTTTLLVEFADVTSTGFGHSSRDVGLWLIENGWNLSMIKPSGKTAPVSLEQAWTGQMVVARKSSSPRTV